MGQGMHVPSLPQAGGAVVGGAAWSWFRKWLALANNLPVSLRVLTAPPAEIQILRGFFKFTFWVEK
jgi:hypothetical protein